MLMGGAVIWAATTIVLRRHRWRSPPLELIPWQLLVALVPVSILLVVFDRGRAIVADPAVIPILAFSGLLATAFAFYASQSITRSLSPMGTTVSFLAVPVVGLASGAIWLREPLGVLDLAGFAMVAAGIAFVTLRASPAPGQFGPTPTS
jgi:drug/metabolite transporter (DMT)-like permease